MLTAFKPTIYADASSLIVFQGPANVTVAWSIQSGPGTLTPLSTRTNQFGVAAARWTPAGATGTAVIRCSHGS